MNLITLQLLQDPPKASLPSACSLCLSPLIIGSLDIWLLQGLPRQAPVVIHNERRKRKHTARDVGRLQPARQRAVFEAAMRLLPKVAEEAISRAALARRFVLDQDQRQREIIIQRAQQMPIQPAAAEMDMSAEGVAPHRHAAREPREALVGDLPRGELHRSPQILSPARAGPRLAAGAAPPAAGSRDAR